MARTKPFRTHLERRFGPYKVEVVGRVADEAIALYSIAQDMRAVVRYWRLAAEHIAADRDDDRADAFWLAGAVTYGRCFAEGTRKGVAHRATIPPELADEHRWILDIRDEHVAHAGRSWMGQDATVVLNVPPADVPDYIPLEATVFLTGLGIAGPARLPRHIELAEQLRLEYERLGLQALEQIADVGETYSRDELRRRTGGRGMVRIDEP